MATSENLFQETMIVRHIPLVHGQSLGCHIYTPGSRPRRPSSLSLTHSISLPERENLSNETLNGDLQGFSSKSSSKERWGISDPGTGNTKGYNSTIVRCHSLFVLESKVNEPEQNCDAYAKNLHKSCKEHSFCQHGNSNVTQDMALKNTTNPSAVSNTACSHNIAVLMRFGTVRDDKQILSDSELQFQRDNEDTPVLMDCGEQDWADEKDCDKSVQKKGTVEEHKCYHCIPNITKAFTDCESLNQTDYISDSSCNSSDGVLVNFSAIYNKTNNAVPATPYDLDSPARQSRGSGSTPQNDDRQLIPCWSPCGVDPNCNIYQADCNGLPSQEISDFTPCQGQLTTFTNNDYKLVTCDLSPQSAASPAWSSLTSCSEVHSHESMTPPTEFFLFGKPETENGEVNKQHVQADEYTELKTNKRTRKMSKGANEQNNHSKTHQWQIKYPEHNNHEHPSATQVFQSWNNTPCRSLPKQKGLRRVLSCPSQISVSSHLPTRHKTSFAELARYKKSPLVVTNRKENPTCSRFFQNISSVQRVGPLGPKISFNTNKNEKESGHSGRSETAFIPLSGVSESCPEVVYNSKPRRPTSLPIQPFVLQPPSGKLSSKALGSLINHYITHKHGAYKSTDMPGSLAHSPLDSYSSINLEVASCSDTCSTCTPTPTEPHSWPHWVSPSPPLFHTHQDLKYKNTKTIEPKLPDNNPGADSTFLDQITPRLNQCKTDHEKTTLKSVSNKHLQSFLSEQGGSHQTPSECLAPESRMQEEHDFFHSNLSPAITSVTSLTPHASLIHPDAGRRNSGLLVKEQHQCGDSSSLFDRLPEESCLTPDPFTKSLPIDLLQKKDMLESLSVAVDLITAHFSSCTDPDEKLRRGNSSLCPRISRLVLDQLCPAFQDVLQDGLRPFKLDLIAGRRKNKPWSVVKASTQPGPSTRMLYSLVSVVKKCSKLTNHSMRLNAFFLGLLNLSALESWFWHLHTSVDVIAEYYQPWAFLVMSQEPVCKPLFQQLLLTLQPLSELPFDLHLLSESKLQSKQEQNQTRFLTLSSCLFLKMPNMQKSDGQPQKGKRAPRTPSRVELYTGCAVTASKQSSRGPVSFVCSKKEYAGWWLSQTPITPRVMEADCSEALKPSKELRWARLFGSKIGSAVAVEKAQRSNQKIRPPSQWLQLGASKVDQLAQSVWSKETSRALCQLQQRPKLQH